MTSENGLAPVAYRWRYMRERSGWYHCGRYQPSIEPEPGFVGIEAEPLYSDADVAPLVAELVQLRADKARLDWLQNESDDLRCFTMSNGDDADIGWRIVGHYMAEPQERVIGEVFHDSVRDAIDAAREALARQGTYSPGFRAFESDR